MKNILSIIVFAIVTSGCSNPHLGKITVSNSLDFDRSAETIELSASDLTALIGDIALNEIVITDNKGNEVVSQVIYEGNKKPSGIIFQPAVKAGTKSVFYVDKGNPQVYEPRAYGRFVPERMDDYAWENDRIAFRIYGTALIAKDGPSNGLDVWVKRTDRMIVDKWYSEYLAGKNSYHDDNGEGCDCYKVGRTLGAGAMAPYVNDSLWLGINFKDYQTLDNGPIRTSFKLAYPAFLVDSVMVTETRTISLDAGSQLNRITEEFTGETEGFMVAAGIVKRSEGKELASSVESGTMAYRLDGGEGGITYIGSILTTPVERFVNTPGHMLMLTNYKSGSKLTYYTGAGWSKWGFENDDAWVNYLSEFSKKLGNPLRVTVE